MLICLRRIFRGATQFPHIGGLSFAYQHTRRLDNGCGIPFMATCLRFAMTLGSPFAVRICAAVPLFAAPFAISL